MQIIISKINFAFSLKVLQVLVYSLDNEVKLKLDRSLILMKGNMFMIS